MNGKYVLVLLLVLLLIICIRMYAKPRVIFTCTTFFDFEKMDRWASFQRAISTLHTYDAQNLPQAWFIVNEYSANPRADWAALMAKTYPQMTFIQKTKEKKGQAHSLNMILEAVKPYDYWIQWEDTWFPERPFLARALDVMRTTQICQLQVTMARRSVSWLNLPESRLRPSRTQNGIPYVEIKADPEIVNYLGRDAHDYVSDWNGPGWPLFSLQPSLNRVSHMRNLAPYSTEPALWPVKFEWDFARRWYVAGGTKAVLPDGPVIRPGHVSTYAK
jgi:hypothetical protein